MKPPLRSVRASPRAGLVRRPAVASAGRQVIRGLVSDTVSAAAELQSSNIRVAVRVRPFNDKETQVNTRSVVNVSSEKLLVFDPKEDNSFFYHGVKQNNRDFTKKANRDVHFVFDRVFSTEHTNQDVFEGTTKDVVDAVLDGFNCSVFAYGATGAGKTHTMLGTEQNPGIIFLTVMELYKRMEELRGSKSFEVSVSYLEVYNENVRDLLAQSNFLAIRDNGNDGITVTGLSLVKPKGAEDLLSLLRYGNSNRTQHPTDHNAESSRSHAVFQVWIKQSDRTALSVKMAKMSLIDLAGSERGCATGHTGERFREGNNINRSLLALGNCINALAEGRKHVPYRDSKLTRLLQDSLGGNCKTVMIAAVSPALSTFEDTYNTLKYADRAKNIKSNVKKNERSVQMHHTQYEKVIGDLRAQLDTKNSTIKDLQVKLEKIEPIVQVVQAECKKCASAELQADALEKEEEVKEECLTPPLVLDHLQTLRDEYAALCHERREITHTLAKYDQLQADLMSRMQQQVQKIERTETITVSNLRLEKLRSRLEREKEQQKQKTDNMNIKREELEKRLALIHLEEDRLRSRAESECRSSKDEFLKLLFHDSLRMKQLEVALQNGKDRYALQSRTLQVQTEEAQQSETVLAKMMAAVKSFYLTLRTTTEMRPYMEDDFNNLVALVEGGRSICWADQKEEVKVDSGVNHCESVTLSPIVESDVRLDVPPVSVLVSRPSTSSLRPSAGISRMNSTAALRTDEIDLNATVSIPQSRATVSRFLGVADLNSTVSLHNGKSSTMHVDADDLNSTVSLSHGKASSRLDSTVVISASDLDHTFSVTDCDVEPLEPVLKALKFSDDNTGAVPLADLPMNVPLQGNFHANVVIADSGSGPANKENISQVGKMSIPASSSIPVRTPIKDEKPSCSQSPQQQLLRRGNLFSKSSTDLTSISSRNQRPTKHGGYMAATTSSKLRQGDNQFLEPPAPAFLAPVSSIRLNPFKRMKKSASTMSLTTQRR